MGNSKPAPNRGEIRESQKLYTTGEAAKAAGVPLATLQGWITTGVISAAPVQPHRGAGVRLWGKAQVRQIRKLRKLRQSSAFLKERSARQAKTLSNTLAPDEARDRMSATAEATWTPERHTQASAAITNSWTVKAVRRRRIKGIKKAWTPKRLEAQAAATAKIMADPEMNARRLAGLRRVNADPELNALRIANLKKANARKGVRRRKIEKMKETLHSPKVNARRSATSKKLWADLRAGRDALAEIAATRNRSRGRPRMEERDREAARLHKLGYTARQIAEKSDVSINAIRKALGRIRKSEKTGGSPDEPKTLHDG